MDISRADEEKLDLLKVVKRVDEQIKIIERIDDKEIKMGLLKKAKSNINNNVGVEKDEFLKKVIELKSIKLASEDIELFPFCKDNIKIELGDLSEDDKRQVLNSESDLLKKAKIIALLEEENEKIKLLDDIRAQLQSKWTEIAEEYALIVNRSFRENDGLMGFDDKTSEVIATIAVSLKDYEKKVELLDEVHDLDKVRIIISIKDAGIRINLLDELNKNIKNYMTMDIKNENSFNSIQEKIKFLRQKVLRFGRLISEQDIDFYKAIVIAEEQDEDKIIELLKRINNEFYKVEIAEKIQDENKLMRLFEDLKDEKCKVKIIKRIQNDEIKLNLINELKVESNKAELITSLRDESKKIELLENIFYKGNRVKIIESIKDDKIKEEYRIDELLRRIENRKKKLEILKCKCIEYEKLKEILLETRDAGSRNYIIEVLLSLINEAEVSGEDFRIKKLEWFSDKYEHKRKELEKSMINAKPYVLKSNEQVVKEQKIIQAAMEKNISKSLINEKPYVSKTNEQVVREQKVIQAAMKKNISKSQTIIKEREDSREAKRSVIIDLTGLSTSSLILLRVALIFLTISLGMLLIWSWGIWIIKLDNLVLPDIYVPDFIASFIPVFCTCLFLGILLLIIVAPIIMFVFLFSKRRFNNLVKNIKKVSWCMIGLFLISSITIMANDFDNFENFIIIFMLLFTPGILIGFCVAEKVIFNNQLKNVNIECLKAELDSPNKRIYGEDSKLHSTIYLTENFIFAQGSAVANLKDILWMYINVTDLPLIKPNGLPTSTKINVGSRIVLRLKNNKAVQIKLGPYSYLGRNIIKHIQQRNPNIILGYSLENRRKYKSLVNK